METSVINVPVLTARPLAQQKPEHLQMSYAAFLDWAGENNTLVEWMPLASSEEGEVDDLNPLMLLLEIRGASAEQMEQVKQILGMKLSSEEQVD